jgi:hypothetical protein
VLSGSRDSPVPTTFLRRLKLAMQMMPLWSAAWTGRSITASSFSPTGMHLYVSLVYTPTHPSLGGVLVISMVTSSGNRSPPQSLMPSLRGIELVLLATRSTCLYRSSVASPGLTSSILLNRTTWEFRTEQAQISTMRPWQRPHLSVHQTPRA